jgi:pyrroloquinoline quinone biosynthesis protein D
MNTDSRLTRRDNVLTQETSDGLVLLDPDGGEYFSLNEVGSRVWELCDGTRTVGDVVGVLAEEFDAPGETIRDDVLELLEELAAEGLVTEAP